MSQKRSNPKLLMFAELADLLGHLAKAHCLSICCLLVRAPKTYREIGIELKIGVPAVTKAVAQLRLMGLVVATADGPNRAMTVRLKDADGFRDFAAAAAHLRRLPVVELI